jgi:hypothetical protein
MWPCTSSSSSRGAPHENGGKSGEFLLSWLFLQGRRHSVTFPALKQLLCWYLLSMTVVDMPGQACMHVLQLR